MVLKVQYKTVFKRNLRALNTEPASLLHKLSSISVETFHNFAAVFYQHINQLAEGLQRLNVAFDCYFNNSLKLQAQMGRGQVVHVCFKLTMKIPSLTIS